MELQRNALTGRQCCVLSAARQLLWRMSLTDDVTVESADVTDEETGALC